MDTYLAPEEKEWEEARLKRQRESAAWARSHCGPRKKWTLEQKQRMSDKVRIRLGLPLKKMEDK